MPYSGQTIIMKTGEDTGEMFDCIIVENEPLVIEMMEDYVTSRSDLRLVGIAAQLDALESLINTIVPDIIFLDLIIPIGNAHGFHYGLLPKSSSVVVVSAIPLSLYEEARLLDNPYELPKPASIEKFNQCVDRVISERKAGKYGERY